MIRKIYNKIMCAGLVCCGFAAAITACTETWDDHYDSLGDSSGMHEGTLWQAIKNNPELSNFASVVEACDFAKSLNSSQVFTVFAPTNSNFSQAEAQALIASYQQQVRDSVVEEDNTVLKEFIQNHVALYNHSVSTTSNDSITLMNGKYAILKSGDIDGAKMILKNQLYGNGVLYTLERPVNYLSNVFEYVRKDADLDSLRSFLYNSKFYYREFMPELSVPGSIIDGKTQYLDSVFTQRNDLFTTIGRLNSEDSSYIMVAPTNAVWRQLVVRALLQLPRRCRQARLAGLYQQPPGHRQWSHLQPHVQHRRCPERLGHVHQRHDCLQPPQADVGCTLRVLRVPHAAD